LVVLGSGEHGRGFITHTTPNIHSIRPRWSKAYTLDPFLPLYIQVLFRHLDVDNKVSEREAHVGMRVPSNTGPQWV
jgi:hypothetical protein